MMRLSLLTGLLLSGCVWITDGDHEDRMDLDGDGLRYDQDCDDDDASVGGPSIWYTDGDGDGYGDAGSATELCEPADEVANGDDCDDGDAAVNPGAEEACDGEDNDCDGLVDDDDDSLVGGADWYPDADGDGYGDGFADPVQACEQPAEHTGVDMALDCDDSDDSIYPDADEYCDGIDHDCDGEVYDDDAVDAATWYLDGDGDGYGLDDSTTAACEQPSGYAAEAGDCDDADTAYNPGASEDDCADPNDYNCDGSTGYADEDGDGWAACEECDDGDAAIHPGAGEYCDDVDNDCDGDIDEDALDASIWYVDGDGDGFGSDAGLLAACAQPSGYDDDADDCDDGDAAVNPAASELCNGVDDDCNGWVDELDPGVLDASDWYPDADSDGYGDASAPASVACDQPSGFVGDNTDCDDADAAVSPAADELPSDACFDMVDNDCDGAADFLDASCAACPYACASEACLYVDGVLEAEQSTALSGAMADVDTLVLRYASFDNVLLGAAGAVLIHEDFGTGLGCFSVGLLDGTTLAAGKAAACGFTDTDLSGGDWVMALDVLAGSADASLALMDLFDSGSGWYDWGVAPVLDDGDGNTVPFTSGAPDQGVDHQVVLCGMSP
jgi:hypothetical protein